MMTTRNWQFTVPHFVGGGSLLVSPYFQTKKTREGTGRVTITLNDMKAIVGPFYNLDNGDGNAIATDVKFFNESNNTGVSVVNFDVANSEAHTPKLLSEAIRSKILTYATNHSFGMVDADIAFQRNMGVGSAVADCPADAVTNYNTVTTLLGALTGAVNTANAKQNQIATQLNSLLAELRSNGIIAT